MTAPDQTNAEESDERLREIEPCPFCGKELEFSESLSIHGGGWMHHGDEANRDKPCFLIGKIVYNTPGDLERWNRRSVTSQASEGEGLADRLQAFIWEIEPKPQVVTPSKTQKIARRLRTEVVEELRSILSAAPVSKRVERLETALRAYQHAVSNCLLQGGVPPMVTGDAPDWWNEIIAAQQQGAQALQGGRS